MGEVWRAEDTKLGRPVAIKVLPAAVAADEERLARFEREAKLLAALNHQNIAAIHAVGETDPGTDAAPLHFLVMELAAGEDLSARLGRGAMPLDEALGVALQVARALEAAHTKGVIHRDLKPGNVKLSPTGEVKVLDFGLAKALDPEKTGSGSEPSLSVSPTLTAAMTQAGVLLGTAAYMSPEQARGQEADRRADVWAFGVILYEMITGRRLFAGAGDTVSDLLAAVLRADPEWEELPEGTPRAVRRLLRRCLERDPDRRLHDIADARIEIEDALSGRDTVETPTVAPIVETPRSDWPRALPWALVAMLAAFAGWLAVRQQPTATEAPLRKLEIAEVEQVSLMSLLSFGGQISPDGSAVAYLDSGKLWLRRLEDLEAREIPGSNFESAPIWSPDSRWLAYPVGRTLWKVPVSGGEPKAITDLPTNVGPFGGGWTRDGRIVLTTGYSGLLEVSAQGGDLREVLAPDPETEADFHGASLLPDGRGVVFSIHHKNRQEGPLAVWDGHSRKVILETKGLTFDTPVYTPTGHLIFHRGPTSPGIWAAPFSLDELVITGDPFLVELDAHSPSTAPDGTLIFVRGGEEEMRELVWVDRSGQELAVAGLKQPGILGFALSPDGNLVAVSAAEGNSRDLWVQDLGRRTKNQLTFSPDAIQGSSFSSDGRRVAYFAFANEPHVFVVDIDGSREPIGLGAGGRPAWSRLQSLLVFERFGARGLFFVEVGDDGAEAEPHLILDPPGDESEPELSPDDQLLAYSADESGRFEVYLTKFPSGEGKWQVSSEGGSLPRWNPAGGELFYVDAEGSVMAATVSGGASPRVGAPVRLFGGLTYGLGGDREFVPASDGQSFLVARSVGEEREKPKLLLVQNWFAEFADSP